MTKRRDLDPELGEQFSVADARRLGHTQRRLDGADLERSFHGSRALTSVAPTGTTFAILRRDHLRRCREFLAIARPGAHFSHLTAAVIYAIPLPFELTRRVEIDVSTSGQPPRRIGVIGHRGDGSRVRMVDGMPVVDPELAWLQLAASLTLRQLVIAGDHLVRLKRPLSSLDRIAAALESCRGARGSAKARTALGLIREGTLSPKESELRLIIVEAGLPEPVVGFTVHYQGAWVGTPDLAYVVERIALEYQGDGHREEAVFLDDIDRLERFHDAGWLVIQVTKVHLRNPQALVARIAWHLKTRAQK